MTDPSVAHDVVSDAGLGILLLGLAMCQQEAMWRSMCFIASIVSLVMAIINVIRWMRV